MNLEPILQSEVSQKEKDIIYECIYMESRKMVLKDLFAGQQWKNRNREQTYGHGKRGGEGEMYGESNTETYITICKIDSQWEFAVCLRKLKRALYQPRGVRWGERWEGVSKGRGYVYTYG